MEPSAIRDKGRGDADATNRNRRGGPISPALKSWLDEVLFPILEQELLHDKVRDLREVLVRPAVA